MITPTDICLITLAAIAVGIGRERAAWLLLADFSVFIGVDVLINVNNVYALWLDPMTALLNVCFMFGFVILGSKYLGTISGLIASYYLTAFTANIFEYYEFFIYEYYVMLTFALLQIGGILPGAYYGILRLKSRNVPDNGRNPSGYHRTHRAT